MKIALLNVLHEPFDKRVYHKVARSLIHAGHELVSVCPYEEDAIPDRAGIHFVRIPPAQSLWQRFRTVSTLVREGLPLDADVYYAPEPESWVAALRIKRRTGAKVVFDMHEHVPSEFAKFFPAFLRRFVEPLTVWFMRRFARRTDLVILTRESFAPIFENTNVPQVTVTNAAHLQPQCTEIPQELRDRYADRPTLIHQGIFGDVRGSWQLLDALEQLKPDYPQLKCIVLGRYVYGDEAEYKQAIRDRGLDDIVDMIDQVPFEEVPAYIAVADIGLILFQPGPLNHTLAMPHKLFDYMREAKSVIVPDFALEVRRIVNEANCGLLVDTANPKAIATAIKKLLDDPKQAHKFGQNGRNAIEHTHNWEHEEHKLLEAIKMGVRPPF